MVGYNIRSKYLNGEWEDIDTAKDWKEAKYLVNEYRLAFGNGFQIKAVREYNRKVKACTR